VDKDGLEEHALAICSRCCPKGLKDLINERLKDEVNEQPDNVSARVAPPDKDSADRLTATRRVWDGWFAAARETAVLKRWRTKSATQALRGGCGRELNRRAQRLVPEVACGRGAAFPAERGVTLGGGGFVGLL
jgi:hypothetical protein